ncbi:MAG: peptidase M28, partial [Sediminibacterium sp.]
MRSSLSFLLSLLLLLNIVSAQTVKNNNKGLSAIREEEVKKDLFEMASDHFRGREAGTLDELKVSMWLADKAKAAGLLPAGDDGTYFQFFSLWRNRISESSKISIGGQNFPLWKEALISQTGGAHIDAPLLFVNKEDI